MLPLPLGGTGSPIAANRPLKLRGRCQERNLRSLCARSVWSCIHNVSTDVHHPCEMCMRLNSGATPASAPHLQTAMPPQPQQASTGSRIATKRAFERRAACQERPKKAVQRLARKPFSDILSWRNSVPSVHCGCRSGLTDGVQEDSDRPARGFCGDNFSTWGVSLAWLTAQKGVNPN